MLKTTYLSRTVVVATTMIVLLSQTVLTQPLFAFTAAPTAVQSPNTATMIVTVVDQTGAVVKDARVSVVNIATGAERDAISGEGGSATFAALSVNGEYKVRVAMSGFTSEDVNGLTLRAGETATVKVKLVAGGGKSEVTVYGTTEGVRADPQIGLPLGSKQIDETPILGRKVTSLPLLNSAFRQGKGTGDLFVNATYFITGAGSRRTTTFTIDGANNDEGWGRQTAIATVPIGAVQEFGILTNAFSAEFGWTAGPALNIVTKSGTNVLHGDGIFMFRPGDWQAETFSTRNFCPPSVSSCVTPSTLQAINPVDIPDELKQFSGAIGGPIIKDKTFFFASADYTRQNRTTFLSPALPAFVLPADGHLDVTGHYRQTLVDARLDHKLTANQSLMFRTNIDRFDDDNPQDAVGGTNAPSVARRYARRSWTTQLNHTAVFNTHLLNEARFAYLHGDPVTLWEAQDLSTTYTRSGTVPFTIGQSRSSDIYSYQFQFSDTLSWTLGKHYLRLGGSLIHHTSGGTGSEPGTAVLGTFTFKSTTTAPFGQLTLADVQNYTQPINFGISSYELPQWLLTGFVQDSIHLHPDFTVDAGLRYDRQTLTDATKNFAPRIGFGWHPGGHSSLSIRGGYAMYYTQIRSNQVAGYLVNGLDGLTTYTAVAGQLGFPTCLTGPCLPLVFDPKTLPASQLPARDITIIAGKRSFYETQFAKFGLDFNKLPNYPEKFVNPRSQVFSIGVERELTRGLVAGADYVHQHWTNLDRTVDLNAPTLFDRSAPGQVRTVAAANATRPIIPVAGGIRQVNTIMNLGVGDYDGLQTQIIYRGHPRIFASLSYTLSKATNTFEPDGNGIGANQSNILRLGELDERGPSVVDQRHRAVITFNYRFPYNITAGTLTQLASSRPFNATTGLDNNGDGANNDRPVIDGEVISKSAFRGTPTSDVALFVEGRVKTSERTSILLRLEGFNVFNHGNYLGRGQTVFGDTGIPNPTFGQLVAVSPTAIPPVTNALPAFANVDPPRMFQMQVRFSF
ncbi:MAG TPA: carboxypeptidase regulatory-like domain-containing protein [Blastocatellia bacterium]|nr:carboxypeptidase regulatory-like domain-containing protein [Blastocatellia bacterium]